MLIAITMGVIGLAGRLPEARKVRRALARMRIDAVTSLPDNTVVTLRGTIELTDPAAHEIAPMSKRPCVYWLVTFDELGAGGDYRELGRAEKSVPFQLHTQSGTVRVVASAPRLGLLGVTRVWPMRELETAEHDDALIRLARAVCKAPNYRRSSLRATEYVVAAGTSVTVKGLCTYEPDPTIVDVDGLYRGGNLPTRPVISGSRRDPLLIA